MEIPVPSVGLDIHYAYLWRNEAQRGQEEGVKDRPCVIVHVVDKGSDTIVTVAPVTHVPQEKGQNAIEIPPLTKRRLGMDDNPSWVVTNELNIFQWPGFDLRPVPRQPRRPAYGQLPQNMMQKIQFHARETLRHRTVNRDMSRSQ